MKHRIERMPVRQEETLDDQIVLRVSREALRSEPPVVRFVGRLVCGQQRVLWPA